MCRDVLCGEGARGPTARCVKICAGRAEGAHKIRADFGGENFRVVEMVCLREEGVVELDGEIEECVDHRACGFLLDAG